MEGWGQAGGTLIRNRQEAGTQIVFEEPPSSSTLIDPLITSGRWLEPGDENAVVIGNHLTTVFPDLKAGDLLTIDIDGRETKWKIIGTYVLTGNVGIPRLYVNYEYLSELQGRPGQVFSLRVLTDRHDPATQQKIASELETLYDKRGIQYSTPALGYEFIRDNKASTDIFVYFMIPKYMHLLNAQVLNLGNPGTPQPLSLGELTIPVSLVTAYHLVLPAQDPIDYDPSEPNRKMEAATILVGHSASKAVCACQPRRRSKSTWTSKKNLSCPFTMPRSPTRPYPPWQPLKRPWCSFNRGW